MISVIMICAVLTSSFFGAGPQWTIEQVWLDDGLRVQLRYEGTEEQEPETPWDCDIRYYSRVVEGEEGRDTCFSTSWPDGRTECR